MTNKLTLFQIKYLLEYGDFDNTDIPIIQDYLNRGTERINIDLLLKAIVEISFAGVSIRKYKTTLSYYHDKVVEYFDRLLNPKGIVR